MGKSPSFCFEALEESWVGGRIKGRAASELWTFLRWVVRRWK